MGTVFLGRSPGGRSVAVKTVRSEFAADSVFRRRFAAEVEAARRVGGFYTAQVVDADPEGDPPWLVTAYVPGPSLAEAVAEHGPLPVRTVRVLGAGLAEGLAAIHDRELVHRDLKPGNVILAADGPRVIDFGIARALDGTVHTATGALLGTPSYMSPEQARGQSDLGPASDVFSYGAVLAFALTGRSPFGSGPVGAVVYRIVQEAPDLTGVPAELRDLIAACLAKDPAERPAVARLVELPSDAQPEDDWVPGQVGSMIARRADRARPAEGTRPYTVAPRTQTTLADRCPDRADTTAGEVGAVMARGRRHRLLGRFATRPPEDLVDAGVRNRKKGDVPAARRALRRAADSGSGQVKARALLELARLEGDEGDTDTAHALFEQVIATGDASYAPASLYCLGSLAQRQGRLDEARRRFEEAIRTGHPEWAQLSVWHLGLLLRAKGEIDAAHDWLRQAALSEHPRVAPDAMFDLGILESGRGNKAAARDWYERAAESGSPSAAPKAMANLGKLLIESEPGGAHAWLERAAVSGHPQAAPMAALNLAHLAKDRGDLAAARRWLEDATRGEDPELSRMAAARLREL